MLPTIKAWILFFFWFFLFDLSFRRYGFIGCLKMDEEICFCYRWFLTETSMVVVMFVHNFYKTLTFWPCFLLLLLLLLLMFWEERDIKESKNIYLASFLIEVGNGTLTELTSFGWSAKFQTTDRQLKFRPNHRWVSCN